MDVRFQVFGHVIGYDIADILYIHTTGQGIGTNQPDNKEQITAKLIKTILETNKMWSLYIGSPYMEVQ